MKNKLLLMQCCLLFVACQPTAHKNEQDLRGPSRPNIVLIMVDDMGFSDLGCYGSEISTPHLDKLASEGTLMTQFYNTAKCTESRSILLSGLYHQQTNNLRRSDNNLTIAELLKSAGYRTIMSGKWHVGDWHQESNTPNERGFDEYFGFLAGAIDFYTGLDFATGVNFMRRNREVYRAGEGFYSTRDFTDFAIAQIDSSLETSQPFFLYLGHNAPHFPLQVPQAYIDKYRNTYMLGWDSLRKQRLARMQQLGMVEESWQLSPRDSLAPAWESLSPDEKAEEDLLMGTYAGMIDYLDEQIGRLTDYLEQRGIAEETLVVFLSDNGGCPYDFNRIPDMPPGPALSKRSYDTEWAQVSNTPFRNYKQWIHEGGIATPMIVKWPGVVEAGRIDHEAAQILDLLPTLLDAADVTFPDSLPDKRLLLPEGQSILALLSGADWQREKPLFWEYRGSRAIRDGRWKLVGERGGPWELYDLEQDRSETTDLAARHPEKCEEMRLLYEAWAARVGASSSAEAEKMPLNRQDRYFFPEERNPALSRK
jgi:arylsulfatase